MVENLNDAILRNESSLKSELAGVAWSCSGSAVGWVLVIAEAGGGSVSAGATWSAIPLTLSATSAATFQCGVAIGRTLNVLTGSADYNNWLDESPTFSALMVALDCLQIVDVVNTLGKQALLYRFLKNKGIGSGNVLKMFKELPRASRKRLAEEILKMDHPKLQKSRKMLKEVLRGQRLLEDGSRAVKVYSQSQVRMLMTTKFLEIIASGITIKGSGQNAQSVAANSISFVIGIGHN
ncbi:hypothetical protein [Oleiphilus messinensis]|nr:hypothetical protein [Oleiphilus messinensis]